MAGDERACVSVCGVCCGCVCEPDNSECIHDDGSHGNRD